jgi:threonine synthase
VALAALEKLTRRGVIRRSDRVIVISTAHGLKFTDFKVQYHRDALEGIETHHANSPIELPADYDRVRDAIQWEIERRFGGS